MTYAILFGFGLLFIGWGLYLVPCLLAELVRRRNRRKRERLRY